MNILFNCDEILLFFRYLSYMRLIFNIFLLFGVYPTNCAVKRPVCHGCPSYGGISTPPVRFASFTTESGDLYEPTVICADMNSGSLPSPGSCYRAV